MNTKLSVTIVLISLCTLWLSPIHADDSELAQVYYQSGLSLLKQNKYDEAIAKFSKAVAYRPDFPSALLKLAECSEKIKDTPGAVKNYRLGIKYLNRQTSRTKDEEQMLSAATRSLEKIDTLGKKLGQIKNSAIAALNQLAGDTLKSQYYRITIEVIWQIKTIDASHKTLTDLVARCANQPGRGAAIKWLVSADRYYRANDFAGAIADYTEALKLDSRWADAYNMRAVAYSYGKKFDLALADFNNAIRFYPRDYVVFANRAAVYLQKGNLDEALEDCNQSVRLKPDKPLGYTLRGFVYFRQKDLDSALADLNKAIELDPRYASAYNSRAVVYASRNDYDGAIADYTEALRYDPNDEVTLCNRARSYTQKGELELAIKDFSKAIQLKPTYADAYYERAILYARNDDYKNAALDGEKFLQLMPGDKRCPVMRGYLNDWRRRSKP